MQKKKTSVHSRNKSSWCFCFHGEVFPLPLPMVEFLYLLVTGKLKCSKTGFNFCKNIVEIYIALQMPLKGTKLFMRQQEQLTPTLNHNKHAICMEKIRLLLGMF